MQLASQPSEKNRWLEFLKILEILGQDGMSSDESTEEEGTHRPCYRVSLLPWRCNICAVMDTIDIERLGEQSGYSKRGSVPTARHRPVANTSGRISKRPPVVNLLAAFYDEGWISTRSQEYVSEVLCGSGKGYEWVIRVANAYSGTITST